VIRVLLADDQALVRAGFRALLDAQPDIEVVGEAADGAEAVRRTTELAPDVVVMDLHMPELNGVDATRAITAAHPDVAVLVLTMLEGDDSVFAAVRAGAKGYLLKGADRAEIGRALDAVAHGEVVFSSSIAQRVLAFFAGGRAAGATPFPELTDREREVLDLIAQGYKNADIATRLVLSSKTVRNHVTNILSKLQVADRAEAIVRAREAGLG
jgi:DNA-binding NarL/FixJ family response regulator